ncbi:probable xyloglucan endotransglucosylase/hydrolase protein, partial [Telopea speciosissima]|uniref:probable xyloglucan endotransglucosylase/hydrolase protein n=1 Tax=Telopea speciosissima TaxID=54955 RepID=UPI001CC69A30
KEIVSGLRSLPASLVSWLLSSETLLAAEPKTPVDVPFQKNYEPGWGSDHIKYINGGSQVQLVLDRSSGAGFHSKASYLFGYFSMRIKLIGGDSAGLVTTFYLSSKAETQDRDGHDELDFEFLGNRTGQPFILQTNVFTGGIGGREERINLWFDPTRHFHTYSILWNKYQIVFFVDNVPIRIFKNNKYLGVGYPISQPLRIYASLWNGEGWATRGGLDKVDWTKAPFVATYASFHVDACPQSAKVCITRGRMWWDQIAYHDLDAHQYRRLRWVRNKRALYSYCRNPSIPRAPECDRNKA